MLKTYQQCVCDAGAPGTNYASISRFERAIFMFGIVVAMSSRGK